jgi:hypothetical protein
MEYVMRRQQEQTATEEQRFLCQAVSQLRIAEAYSWDTGDSSETHRKKNGRC